MSNLDSEKDLKDRLDVNEQILEASTQYQQLPVKYQNIPESQHVVSTVIAFILQRVNRPYGTSITPAEARLSINELREIILVKYQLTEDNLPLNIRKAFVDAENKIDTDWSEISNYKPPEKN